MRPPAPGSLDACLKSLAADPSRAGFEFERVAAWWLTTDPVWSSRVKRVWAAKDWLGRSGNQDLGTDLTGAGREPPRAARAHQEAAIADTLAELEVPDDVLQAAAG